MIPSPAQALARGGPGIALAWPGDALDYPALAREVSEFAAAIDEAFPKDRPVAVVGSSSNELALGVLAADWAGRGALPLDPARPGAADLVARAGCGAMVCDTAGFAPGLPRIGFDARATARPPRANGEGGLIVATSGSTGTPRLVRLERRALSAQAGASAAVLPALEPGALWLVCLPMTSIGGLAAMWRALGAGAGVAVLPRFEAACAARQITQRVTHVSVVPAMLPALMEALPRVPATVACVLAGGGPLSGSLAAAARRAGWPLWTGWGMTETASHVAAGPVDAAWEEGIAGRPLPGVDITVDALSGRLRVAGPTLASGYLGEPEAGFDGDGTFLTGDVGRIEPDGRVRILGRSDGVIVTGGVNVHPEEVEALLTGCPGIGDVAVGSVPDPRWGRRLVALYDGTVAPGDADAWARATWAEEGWAAALRPRTWRRIRAVPRNAMGKIDRPALDRIAGDA